MPVVTMCAISGGCVPPNARCELAYWTLRIRPWCGRSEWLKVILGGSGYVSRSEWGAGGADCLSGQPIRTLCPPAAALLPGRRIFETLEGGLPGVLGADDLPAGGVGARHWFLLLGTGCQVLVVRQGNRHTPGVMARPRRYRRGHVHRPLLAPRCRASWARLPPRRDAGRHRLHRSWLLQGSE